MSQIELDDFDFDQAESRVIIEIRATKREIIQDEGRYDDTTYFETEGTLTYEQYLEKSLINLDAYFDPDYFYDWPTEFSAEMGPDNVEFHTSLADISIRFDAFESEIRAGATQRAHEDRSHPVRVLASWLWQVGGGTDHIEPSQAHVFYSALADEIHNTPVDEIPDWALCYSGDPTNWRHDEDDSPVVDTLDEARIYARGGYKAVKEARGEADG